ncbi:MAG: hypothetical protein J5730_01765 [Bacteroidales bacterium]|nr:hypothetical protein [Bacteroidales bacterium]
MKKSTRLLLPLLVMGSICFSQNTEPWKVRLGTLPIDYTQPIHSIGFTYQSALAFSPKPLVTGMELLVPHMPVVIHVPEFSFQYTCLFPNRFGFAIEIPFGIFQRSASFDLRPYGMEEVIPFQEGSFYAGFSPKLIYALPLRERCILQAEAGLRFMPFIHPSYHWDEKSYETPHSDIISFQVFSRAYLIPDASASVLFLLHTRKRPQNNFVVGFCGYLSFVKRMSISYDTRENQDFPVDLFTNGWVEWNSSTIGIIVGYRFLGLKP